MMIQAIISTVQKTEVLWKTEKIQGQTLHLSETLPQNNFFKLLGKQLNGRGFAPHS